MTASGLRRRNAGSGAVRLIELVVMGPTVGPQSRWDQTRYRGWGSTAGLILACGYRGTTGALIRWVESAENWPLGNYAVPGGSTTQSARHPRRQMTTEPSHMA